MRIGLGYDVHAFAEGRRLVLGGVEIAHDRGLLGHSDADVLAHALADAVLGALREGDIGRLFPDTDPAYRDADSIELLAAVGKLASDSGWRVRRCGLRARSPSSPRSLRTARRCAPTSRARWASRSTRWASKRPPPRGLGFAGREEGIAAQAVVLLERVE